MACQYEELDAYGATIGITSFIVGLLFAYSLLRKFDLNRKSVCIALSLSGLGHFIGAYALFEFAVRVGADTCFYFANTTLEYQGTGYFFAFTVIIPAYIILFFRTRVNPLGG